MTLLVARCEGGFKGHQNCEQIYVNKLAFPVRVQFFALFHCVVRAGDYLRSSCVTCPLRSLTM